MQIPNEHTPSNYYLKNQRGFRTQLAGPAIGRKLININLHPRKVQAI